MNKESVYFRNGKLVSKSGDVRIYQMNNELFLEDGRMNLISSDDNKSEYIWQLGDKPTGDCLVVGLGLATAAKYLLTMPKVTSVTVVEKNKSIIEAVSNVNKADELFKIEHADYLPYLYTNTTKYDFIFVDCYAKVEGETLPYIADITVACKTNLNTGGILLGWLDVNTPEKFIESFYSLFNLP